MNSAQDQNGGKAGALVPPRPNLGPEPWPQAQPGWGSLGGFAVTGVLLLVLVVWQVSKRRASPKKASVLEGINGSSHPLDPSPRQKLIVTSRQVRESLLQGFGPSWGSRTTEEIGGDSRIIDRLEPHDFARLMGFLKLADRAKFADDVDSEALEEWATWANGFLDRLADRPKSEPAKSEPQKKENRNARRVEG